MKRGESQAGMWAALAVVYVVWGSTYLGIELAVRTLPPFLMLAARFLLAGALLFAWSLARAQRPRRLPSLGEWRAAFVVAAALLGGGNGAVAWAEDRGVETGTAALIIASVPLWLALFDRLLYGERLGAVAGAGLVVGLGGVAVLVAPGGGSDVAGEGALLGGAMAWALGSLYARQAPSPGPLLGASMQMLAAGLLLAVVGLGLGEAGAVEAVSGASLGGFAYLVLFGSVLGFTAYGWLLRTAPTALVGTYAYVNPLVAVLLGTVFLEEPLGWRLAGGGGIVLLSVAAIVTCRLAGRGATPAAGSARERERYSEGMTYLDLRAIRLRSGEELRDERDVEIAPIELGGQRYVAVPERVRAALTVTKATTGTVFELRFHARLHGPCYRCLDDAVVEQTLALREYQDESPRAAEELTSPYIVERRLDLSAWARDSLVLALPQKILCRPSCAGLCATCGENLNRRPHRHEEPAADGPWAALAELRDRL